MCSIECGLISLNNHEIHTGRGVVSVYHTNSWHVARRTGQHWAGDLPTAEARKALEQVRTELTASGWPLDQDNTKILMLTHKVLAEEQGYSALANVFSHNESFLKKEDPHIGFFADTLEPVCRAYEARRFGDMFRGAWCARVKHSKSRRQGGVDDRDEDAS